jgi:hypothetical protein
MHLQIEVWSREIPSNMTKEEIFVWSDIYLPYESNLSRQSKQKCSFHGMESRKM